MKAEVTLGSRDKCRNSLSTHSPNAHLVPKKFSHKSSPQGL